MRVTFTDVFGFTIIVSLTLNTGACLESATLDPVPKIYNNLSHVLSYIQTKENTNHLTVREALYNFEKLYMLSKENTRSATERFPFISIEGMDLSGSKVLAEKVAQEVGGILLRHPPSIFDKYEEPLQNTSVKNPFRFLMLYATAFTACATYVKSPVLVEKYFFDTAFKVILDECQGNILAGLIPLYISEEIKWPEDLLKPDFSFYVTIDEQTRKRRARMQSPYSEDNLPRLISGIIKKFSDKPIILDGNKALRNVLADVMKPIRDKGLFKNK